LLEGEYLVAVYSDSNHKDCSITETFRIVGKSWTVIILRELFMGANRFSLIKKGVGRDSKILSIRLKDLEDAEVLARRVTPGRPVKIEYSLTEKGSNLFPLILPPGSIRWRIVRKWSSTMGSPTRQKRFSEKCP
jgi:DNA-binding HxlR family transcriptional regulator